MKAKFVLILALGSSAMLFGGCTNTRPVTTAAPADFHINNIRMFDRQNGWAEASGPDGYRILRTTDGAQTWKNVTPQFGTLNMANFWGCEFAKPQTAWITFHTNSFAGLLMTTNGGNSWTQVIAPFGFFTEASDVHFVNDNFGVSMISDGGLGSSYDTFYQTRDAGMTWKKVPLTPPDSFHGDRGTVHLSNINGDKMDFYPPGTFFIIYGESDDEPPKGYVRLAISSDMGQSWREARLPLPGQWRDGETAPLLPVFYGPRDGFLPVEIFKDTVNSRVFVELLFYRTCDGGQSWTLQQSLPENGNGLVANTLDIISTNNIIVRTGGVLNVTHDGAKTWHTLKPNINLGLECSRRDVAQINFADATHGWMIITDDNTFSPYGNLSFYKTVNGGETWAELPLKIRE